jgi:hypothetical protein
MLTSSLLSLPPYSLKAQEVVNDYSRSTDSSQSHRFPMSSDHSQVTESAMREGWNSQPPQGQTNVNVNPASSPRRTKSINGSFCYYQIPSEADIFARRHYREFLAHSSYVTASLGEITQHLRAQANFMQTLAHFPPPLAQPNSVPLPLSAVTPHAISATASSQPAGPTIRSNPANDITPEKNSDSTPSLIRTVFFGTEKFEFDEAELPKPPKLTYSQQNGIRDLAHDWEDSGYIVLQGRRIPIKDYRALYHRSRFWEQLKGWWSDSKACTHNLCFPILLIHL